jgi:hypothetical protein
MSASKNTVTLGGGLVVAFVASACGAALLAALTPWFGGASTLRAVVALLGFAYTLYVVARSGERVGRVTTVAGWLVIAIGAWAAPLSLAGYVLVHVGLVWLVRSLYCYSSVVPALVDLGVSLLGAAFAAWAAQRSGSAWLALWCFFLLQAFHVLIPASLTRDRVALDTGNEPFARAHRAAEAAVRRLTSSTH